MVKEDNLHYQSLNCNHIILQAIMFKLILFNHGSHSSWILVQILLVMHLETCNIKRVDHLLERTAYLFLGERMIPKSEHYWAMFKSS